MKPLLYALFLLAVLVGSVILLRSIDHDGRHAARPTSLEPLVESASPRVSQLDTESLSDAPAREIYEIGMEFLDLWHVREACEAFEQAVEADSTLYLAHVRLAECYAHPLLCREDRARDAWEKAMATRVSDADTTFLKGMRELFIAKNYRAAVERFKTAERAEVSHDDARYYLALALFLSGQPTEAERKLEDLLSEPDAAGRVFELSIRCATAGGRLEEAEDQARGLARMFSGEPFPYVILAQIELLRGDRNSAVEFCNNALTLDPKYIPAVLTRANLYCSEGSYETARVSYEKLLLFDDPILRAIGMEGTAFVDFLCGRFADGMAAMDEAIRNAILVGSVRRGLSYATRLVEYLCELGQRDSAEGVVDRWITGFGDVPVSLGQLRIDILDGDREKTRRALLKMRSDSEWESWMGAMSIDYSEMAALTKIGQQDPTGALEVLREGGATGPSASGNRLFLEGYASFESGDAEAAGKAFDEVSKHLFGVEFPYHGDPVLHVQALFYLSETLIASGHPDAAARHYKEFLDYWRDADWDIQAVARAKEKLKAAQ